MKLLHTGDLHLDSAFCGDGPLQADRRREAQRQLLIRIFDCAGSEACDMILMAGDVFDSKYVTPETGELFCRLCREASCPIVIAPGNHDPYIGGSFYRTADLPEHVYVFSAPEVQRFDFDELHATVYGYAFCSAALTESPLNQGMPPQEDGRLRLLCAHADLGVPLSRYAPVTAGDICSYGIDYAALGHVHNPHMEKTSYGSTEIRYCGFPEGRSFDEEGDGGVLLVTVKKGEPVQVERRVLSQQRYFSKEVDVSSCNEEQELWAILQRTASAYDPAEGTHLRLTLVGEIESDWVKDGKEIEKRFRGNLSSLTIKDLTSPPADTKALEQDITLRGEFYRTMYAGLSAEDPKERRLATLALQIGLAAIDNKQIPERSTEK